MSEENKPEATHFVVSKNILQATFDYLGTRPAAEVLELMNALKQDASGVVVKEAANENQDQEAQS